MRNVVFKNPKSNSMKKFPFFQVAVVLLLSGNLFFMFRLDQKIPKIPKIYSKGALEKISSSSDEEEQVALDSQAVFKIKGYVDTDTDVNIKSVGGDAVGDAIPVEFDRY